MDNVPFGSDNSDAPWNEKEELDLNSEEFDYIEIVDLDEFLKEIPDYQIYSFYMQEQIELGRTICSPLRSDSHPSFSFFKSRNGRIMFKDHAYGWSGDCFEFIKRKYSLKTRSEAAHKIRKDMEKGEVQEVYYEPKDVPRKDIRITPRPWANYDEWWWKQFGITVQTLNKYDVSPVKYLWINEDLIPVVLRTYAYAEYKDGKPSYKIYQPEAPRERKWMSNVDRTIHQGYTRLPDSGDLLIITKALKDVMSLHDTLGISAIGLQGENIPMKPSVMDEYKSRFIRVLVLFDADGPGKTAAKKFCEENAVKSIVVPDSYMCKDYSDLVKEHGERIAKGAMIKMLEK